MPPLYAEKAETKCVAQGHKMTLKIGIFFIWSVVGCVLVCLKDLFSLLIHKKICII